MNIKNSVLSLGLAAVIALPSIASPSIPTVEPVKESLKEIERTISKLDIDFKVYEGTQVKIKFMINDNREIIVLSTNDTHLDGDLKRALNYMVLEDDDLVPYRVYILPLKFESK